MPEKEQPKAAIWKGGMWHHALCICLDCHQWKIAEHARQQDKPLDAWLDWWVTGVKPGQLETENEPIKYQVIWGGRQGKILPAAIPEGSAGDAVAEDIPRYDRKRYDDILEQARHHLMIAESVIRTYRSGSSMDKILTDAIAHAKAEVEWVQWGRSLHQYKNPEWPKE